MRRAPACLLAAALLAALAGCGADGISTASEPAPHTTVAAATTTVPAVTTPAKPKPKPRTVSLTVAATGDFLIHSPVWQRAAALAHGRGYDFRPMLRLIRPYIQGADLALCHVEVPMAPGRLTGYPVFNSPPALARSIKWAGYDACDTASNHSLDGGQRGIDATGRSLDRYGIAHTGSARSAAAQRRIVMLKAKGMKVALLAYTAVSNGQVAPHRWSVNRADPRRILADARRARRLGADAVIVNLHWGEEYATNPSGAQRALARRLTASRDITAVVGQHVHVVQPVRLVGHKLVVFGEGNLLSNQTPSCCAPGAQDGLLALLRLRVRDGHARLVRVDYVPTWVRHPDFTVIPVGAALRRGLQPQGELRASWNRTVRTVGRTRLYAPWARATP